MGAKSIGIVEMGGLGSLLRTSAIVYAIRQFNSSAAIDWYTHTRGADLLKYVPGVKAVDIERQDLATIEGVESLDVLLNFELNSAAHELALRAREVGCFTINRYGNFAAASEHAYGFQRLQIDDAHRKANFKTMQQILLESIGLSSFAPRYHISLPEQNKKNAEDILNKEFEGSPYNGFIGINLGSSEKGKLKRWPATSITNLSLLLGLYNPDYGIALLSGPEDESVRQQVGESLEGSGLKNIKVLNNNLEIGDFMGVIGNMQLVITGDTFAFHAARAQDIPLVALAGPMPYQEIELSINDLVIGPKMDCSTCYYRCKSNIKGECMHLITVNEVFGSAMNVLQNSKLVKRGKDIDPYRYTVHTASNESSVLQGVD